MSNQHSKKKPPPKTDTNTNTDTASNTVLVDRLNELKLKLKKSFSNEFIESVSYFLAFEHQRQDNLEASLSRIEWSKLNYFLQQLKKICKQRQHLFLFIQKLQISGSGGGQASSKSTCGENEVGDLSDCSQENFSLIRVMIRLMVKAMKFSCCGEQRRLQVGHDAVELFKLELAVLSCLADMCFYEEIRMQVRKLC